MTSLFTQDGADGNDFDSSPAGSSSIFATTSPAPSLAPFVDVDRSTLTDGQEVIMSVLSLISGTLSFIGSSLIVYRVYKNRNQTVRRKTSGQVEYKTTPYDRIMLGLSCSDMVASLTHIIGPFLLPSETSPRVWASGNDRTCSFLGFLTQFAFAAVWYNGMLSFYYLLTVRFGVKRQVFAKRLEPFIHISTLVFFMGTAMTGVAIGLYSELEITQGCWIGEYPQDGCEERGDCTGALIGWVFGGVPFLFTFLSLPVNNLSIYMYTRRQLSLDTASQATQAQRIREVATQGFLYVFTFYVCYTPAFIVRVLESLGLDGEKESEIYPVLVLNAALLPLQGFFNVFIYARPNYVRVQAAFPEQPKWWQMRHACLESDIPTLTQIRSLYSSQGTTQRASHRHLGTGRGSGGSNGSGGSGSGTGSRKSASRRKLKHGGAWSNPVSSSNSSIASDSAEASGSRRGGLGIKQRSFRSDGSRFSSDLDIIPEVSESFDVSTRSMQKAPEQPQDERIQPNHDPPSSSSLWQRISDEFRKHTGDEESQQATAAADAQRRGSEETDKSQNSSGSFWQRKSDEFKQGKTLEDIEAEIEAKIRREQKQADAEKKMARPQKSSFRIVNMDGSVVLDDGEVHRSSTSSSSSSQPQLQAAAMEGRSDDGPKNTNTTVDEDCDDESEYEMKDGKEALQGLSGEEYYDYEENA